MRRVLIIDDNLRIRQTLSLLLEMKHFSCLEACDGQEGWEIYLEQRPDLVLLDYRMPKINGLELLGMIKQHDPCVPIIFFSADRELEKLENLYRADRVFPKPFTVSALLGAISDLLGPECIETTH